MKKFLDHCCQERLYSFSIKNCCSTACSICAPPQLPTEVFETLHHIPDPIPDVTGEHYQKFETLYWTCTTEKYCPSLVEKNKKSYGMPLQPNTQFARCVCGTLQCCECLKPRVLYSQRKRKLQEAQYLGSDCAGRRAGRQPVGMRNMRLMIRYPVYPRVCCLIHTKMSTPSSDPSCSFSQPDTDTATASICSTTGCFGNIHHTAIQQSLSKVAQYYFIFSYFMYLVFSLKNI